MVATAASATPSRARWLRSSALTLTRRFVRWVGPGLRCRASDVRQTAAQVDGLADVHASTGGLFAQVGETSIGMVTPICWATGVRMAVDHSLFDSPEPDVWARCSRRRVRGPPWRPDPAVARAGCIDGRTWNRADQSGNLASSLSLIGTVPGGSVVSRSSCAGPRPVREEAV